MAYAELHAHSAYSFLDGSSLPDELAAAAAQRGYAAFALTDHNSLSGSMEFAQAAKAVGVKAIHGAEVDVIDEGPRHDPDAPRRHLTLLVREERGWRNLCRLLTRAHAHTRGSPEEPQQQRRDLKAACVTLDDVAEHAAGLVCLSGCAGHGVHDAPTLERLRSAFGRESLRVELQRPFLRHDRALNRELAALAERIGVETVATGDVHAHTRDRAMLQDALVAIREHTTLDASEPLRRGNHSNVLATPRAMEARFPEHPAAVRNAAALADELSFDLLEDLGYRYPHADDPDADRKLAEITRAAFDARYPHGHGLRDEALARLDEELAVIRHLGLSGFFILHRDLLELAREVALEVRGPSVARSMLPPGRGRGSSVSSIVCYLTGLSHVDPIANKLLLGRFLNEEIVALPDIDLDFPRDIREVLIPRVHDRYGREHSALVAAFPTYRARGAVREIGKALGLPPGEIERVARSSEAWSGANVDKDIAVALGKGRERRGRWAWLAKLSEEAHGLPRHLSQHSGGMIVSTRPLVDCVPLVPAAMEGRQLAQWDKDSCSDAGFLKIDLLGLGMLSAVERCVDHIAARRGEHIDLSRIPYDDQATYDSIQAADTTGVFQIESRAQMASLHRTRPENLDDITIQVAIVRPGPIVGGAVNPYIARKQRLREDPSFEVPYEHPSLEEPLRDTLGTIIFQDQVIEVARAFAGFTHSEAEGLRRAMSRKRSEAAIRAYTERFVEGAMAEHPDVDEEMAHRVYEMIVGFSGFGFPKGHGAAFGLLAYQSAWLRVHYGPEFVCSLLDEQPMGFYPSDALVHEAQRRGIEVLPVDVNASEVGCTVTQEGAVRIGLGYVLGARSGEVASITAERAERGPYRSVEDLASRSGAGRPTLERLAWSGACDGLVDGDRRVALWQLGVATPGYGGGEGTTQLSLPLDLPGAPPLEALEGWPAMVADYASTGLTTGTHPMGLLRDELAARGAVHSAALRTMRHKERVRIGGVVVARQRPGTAKGVVFMLLEDEHGTINLVVPPDIYERDRLIVRSEPLVIAEGILERHPAAGGAINVLVKRLRALDAPDTPLAQIADLAGHISLMDFSVADAWELELLAEADAGVAAAAGGGAAGAGGASGFRAVAPPVQSFASGRRR